MTSLDKIISIIRTVINEFRKASTSTLLDSIRITLGLCPTSNVYTLRNGVQVHFSSNTLDRMVIRECFINNSYSRLLKERALKTVLDFGSHKGYFLLGLLNAQVAIDTAVCVEPLVENIKVCRENMALNKNTLLKRLGRLTIEQAAISDHSGNATLYVTQDSVSHSLIDPSLLGKTVVSTRQVKLITPKQLFKKHKITSVDLLKMDIEGEEFSLFSSPQMQYFVKARYIVMEIHPSSAHKKSEITDTLKTFKFIIEIPNSAWDDLIFARRD